MPLYQRFLYGAAQFAALAWMLGAWPALQALGVAVCSYSLLSWVMGILLGCTYLWISKEVRILWPALLTTFLRVGDRFTWPALLPAVLYCALTKTSVGQKSMLPTWDSKAAMVGAAIGALTCVIYFSELLSSLGFPPGMKLAQRFAVSLRFRYVALFLASSAAIPAAAAPRWMALPVAMGGLAYLMWAVTFTVHLAQNSFDDCPIVSGTTPPPLTGGERPWVVHVTDIHLVGQGMERIEGGFGGNARLEMVVSLAREQHPALFLISGDFTDHGAPEEYDEGRRIIAPLMHPAARTTILFAPGNHDLGTAYTADTQLMALGHSKFDGGGPRGVNGLLILRYFQEAVWLHEKLEDCTGDLLSKRLNVYASRDEQFEQVLSRTRERVRLNPLDFAAVDEVIAAGEDAYPRAAPARGWHPLIPLAIFRQVYLPSWYVNAWYEPFPLRAHIDDATDVFILNSVSPDVTLAGSAWGELGETQIERLGVMLSLSVARRCVILLHHPPFRWADEVPPRLAWADLQRWAFLQFGIEDVRALRDVLQANARGRQIVIFCGHRHGFKAAGSTIPACRSGTDERACFAEGASLADRGTAVIGGLLEDDRLQFRSLGIDDVSQIASR